MDSESSPDPMGLVSHINRSKTGISKLQLTIPIELRARMAQAALDLGCSKLALIRAAISQFLIAHEESQRSGQERAYTAVSEVVPPVPDLVSTELDRPTPEPEMPPEPPTPVPTPEPARSPRGRKEKS